MSFVFLRYEEYLVLVLNGGMDIGYLVFREEVFVCGWFLVRLWRWKTVMLVYIGCIFFIFVEDVTLCGFSVF